MHYDFVIFFFLKNNIKYIDVIDLSENRVFGTFIKGE